MAAAVLLSCLGGMVWDFFRCRQFSPVTFLALPLGDRLRVRSMDLPEGGTTRAEDAWGTPSQSHISPGMLAYEDHTAVTIRHI